MSEYLPCLQQNCQKPAKKRSEQQKNTQISSVLLMIIVFPRLFFSQALSIGLRVWYQCIEESILMLAVPGSTFTIVATVVCEDLA